MSQPTPTPYHNPELQNMYKYLGATVWSVGKNVPVPVGKTAVHYADEITRSGRLYPSANPSTWGWAMGWEKPVVVFYWDPRDAHLFESSNEWGEVHP